MHLLLALDLFIAVVGVDPRWLLRSLRRQYRSVLTSASEATENDESWESTPQDYLEKIFNIPFALPRMSADGFTRLVQRLAEPRSGTTGPLSNSTQVRGAGGLGLAFEEPARIAAEPGSEIASTRTAHSRGEAQPLTPRELEFLAALASLVRTPRETKRLLNLYRMIRATRNLSVASTFLGDESHPGEHQAVALLLGALAGYPGLYEALLSSLMERPTQDRWSDIVAAMSPHATEGGRWTIDLLGDISLGEADAWRALSAGLADISALVTLPDLHAFKRWAPRIGRFSFRLAVQSSEHQHVE